MTAENDFLKKIHTSWETLTGLKSVTTSPVHPSNVNTHAVVRRERKRKGLVHHLTGSRPPCPVCLFLPLRESYRPQLEGKCFFMGSSLEVQLWSTEKCHKQWSPHPSRSHSQSHLEYSSTAGAPTQHTHTERDRSTGEGGRKKGLVHLLTGSRPPSWVCLVLPLTISSSIRGEVLFYGHVEMFTHTCSRATKPTYGFYI